VSNVLLNDIVRDLTTPPTFLTPHMQPAVAALTTGALAHVTTRQLGQARFLALGTGRMLVAFHLHRVTTSRQRFLHQFRATERLPQCATLDLDRMTTVHVSRDLLATVGRVSHRVALHLEQLKHIPIWL